MSITGTEVPAMMGRPNARRGSTTMTRGAASQACRERVPAWRPPGAHDSPDAILPSDRTHKR
jgi:hypothetical protein